MSTYVILSQLTGQLMLPIAQADSFRRLVKTRYTPVKNKIAKQLFSLFQLKYRTNGLGFA